MEFKALVTDSNIYKKYVEVLNSLFGLAEREMDVFASLLKIDMEWGSDEPKDIIDTRSRKQLMKETLINKNNLSKYVGKLKSLKIIIYNNDKDGWIINKNLVPTLQDNKFNVNFVLQIREDE
jgi:hypothetical protein